MSAKSAAAPLNATLRKQAANNTELVNKIKIGERLQELAATLQQTEPQKDFVERVYSDIQAILSSIPEVCRVSLAGSTAKGTDTQFSDLDLLECVIYGFFRGSLIDTKNRAMIDAQTRSTSEASIHAFKVKLQQHPDLGPLIRGIKFWSSTRLSRPNEFPLVGLSTLLEWVMVSVLERIGNVPRK
ncbi:hypothetical protein HDV05_008296 [Chytridiales sp. JEL 0842]|nr:hypothetical protein HDV05_008296 [Chytridiales sp. JEL 0842]